jgi:Flp pilus assembly pilin Flp
MRCTNLTDDELWRAIEQNTEAMSALFLQQLELDAASGPIDPGTRADLIRFANRFQDEYREYSTELRSRYHRPKNSLDRSREREGFRPDLRSMKAILGRFVRGRTAIEYGIIAALISVATVGAFSLRVGSHDITAALPSQSP